jgi:hypothetical protein
MNLIFIAHRIGGGDEESSMDVDKPKPKSAAAAAVAPPPSTSAAADDGWITTPVTQNPFMLQLLGEQGAAALQQSSEPTPDTTSHKTCACCPS